MNHDLYHIVYCSRNLIRYGDKAVVAQELQTILTKSRTNNQKAGITGALIYSAGSFAQVLEGPLPAIERTFEVIQRDSRHSDVTVVQIGPIEKRKFGEWAMAFSGNNSAESKPEVGAAFEAIFSNSPGGAEQILTILQELLVSDIDWALLDAA